MSFLDDLKRFQAKTDQKMIKVINTTILGVVDSLIELSPWGDWEEWSIRNKKRRPYATYKPGRFKGSWTYSRRTPVRSDPETIDATGDTSRSRTLGGMAWTIKQVATIHYLTNNTPYAMSMETTSLPDIPKWHLVGHNIQLGHMVEVTAQKFQTILNEAVANVG